MQHQMIRCTVHTLGDDGLIIATGARNHDLLDMFASSTLMAPNGFSLVKTLIVRLLEITKKNPFRYLQTWKQLRLVQEKPRTK